jgi:MoCo/4Fe-4S cofactor protein with predicted Tat translocation signal
VRSAQKPGRAGLRTAHCALRTRDTMSDQKTLDFKSFRTRIGDLRGREYWRSLEELARTEAFDEFFQEEFPRQAVALGNGVDRRNFIKLMGASVAAAGLAACRQPPQEIIPYVKQPENLIPGNPMFFASAIVLGGYASGVLVESHEFHPTKIEGNPDHPSSLGATDAFMQASILGLYDPDRSQVVKKLGDTSTWSEFIAALQPILAAAKTNGAGLRLLTQTVTSPTLGAQIQQMLALYPGMKWHQWEAVNRDNVREGARLAFGNYVDVHYDLTKADVIVSLASNFLDEGPGHLRYARDFASRRRVRKGTTSMNRLYAIESSYTSTGSVADHRIKVRPSEMEFIARSLLSGAPASPAIAAIAKDLKANAGKSLVIAGDDQPAIVHAIAHAINSSLGNIGSTVLVTDPIEIAPTNQLESLHALSTDMHNGVVKALIILGGNPVFDAPADFQFHTALTKVPFRAHLSHYYDETSMLAHWHIPEVHSLESWSDARAHDGTVSIIQPLIAPLYNGRSAHEVLGTMIGGMDQSPYDTVRAYWKNVAPPPSAASDFETRWRKWLHDGLIENSALPARTASAAPPPPIADGQQPTAGLQLEIKHDPTIYDGRFANNAWLQELPKPQTKIVWENVLLLSPRTADRLHVRPDDSDVNEKRTFIAKLTFHGVTTEVPVWVVPGHTDDVATICYGYGREHGGRVANGTGVNIYPMRFSDAMNGGAGVQIERSDKPLYPIACTQEHQSIDPKLVGERGIIKAATFTEYLRDPNFAHEARDEKETREEANASMYEQYPYPQYRWAMSIDTSVCTGCNGCVIACVSENNISVVGKEEVHREREMHWLRIDRYYRGDAENPDVYHQPVPCMQCEQAPCEPVCPVEATSHSGDGLNDMTYNRCVGTRYCSNNCPYKVRRFNFFHYADYDTPSLKPMRNPHVTIRTRGVMEKCTYCVQRINETKITAERENRRVRDGEFTTACAQSCPTEAIVFGDLNDPTSRVSKLKLEPTDYTLLPELNTRPRTSYLATIKNPNPEIKG